MSCKLFVYRRLLIAANRLFYFKTCNKARCSCAETQRHVDPKRPHRQDLCGRCKGKRLSCDSTFSFKYIV